MVLLMSGAKYCMSNGRFYGLKGAEDLKIITTKALTVKMQHECCWWDKQLNGVEIKLENEHISVWLIYTFLACWCNAFVIKPT